MEIQKILELKLPTERIVYANPCKQISHIRYAAKTGVSLMTFDNETELYKIKSAFPLARYGYIYLSHENTHVQQIYCTDGRRFVIALVVVLSGLSCVSYPQRVTKFSVPWESSLAPAPNMPQAAEAR